MGSQKELVSGGKSLPIRVRTARDIDDGVSGGADTKPWEDAGL